MDASGACNHRFVRSNDFMEEDDVVHETQVPAAENLYTMSDHCDLASDFEDSQSVGEDDNCDNGRTWSMLHHSSQQSSHADLPVWMRITEVQPRHQSRTYDSHLEKGVQAEHRNHRTGFHRNRRTVLSDIATRAVEPTEMMDVECSPAANIGGVRRKNPMSLKKNGNWTSMQLMRAKRAVDNDMPIRTAAREYDIPPTSLQDHLFGITRSHKRGGGIVLTTEEESLLVSWILDMQESGYPITLTSLRLKVAEVTETRVTPFTQHVPRRGWMRWFRKRHPELTLRRSQGLEAARARNLCKENVATFYENIWRLYDLHHYPPHRVWNCDESGCQGGSKGGALVLAKKGGKVVHSIIPDAQEWLFVLVCINANGSAIPSFYIFRGKRFRRNYIEKYEPGATMAMQPCAWMTAFLFSKWISHFIWSVREKGDISPTQQHLLVLDGHNSHVTFDVVTYAKDVDNDIVSLPSHTSHAMQLLDVSVFKPFKEAFQFYRDAWCERNSSKKVSKEILAQWVSLGLQRALTERNIMNGFASIGIFPYNTAAMDEKMGCAMTFSQINGENDNATSLEVTVEELNLEMEQFTITSESTQYYVDEQHVDVEIEAMVVDEQCNSDEDIDRPVSIFRFLTLPIQASNTRTRSRATLAIDYTKSMILTSTEYVDALVHCSEEKEAVEQEKEIRRAERENSKKRKLERKNAEEIEKANKVLEKRLKKEFNEYWLPKNLAIMGKRLHDNIVTNLLLGPNDYKAPVCGLHIPICKYMAIAIRRRMAKKRGEDMSLLPALVEPKWVHRPSAPLRPNNAPLVLSHF